MLLINWFFALTLYNTLPYNHLQADMLSLTNWLHSQSRPLDFHKKCKHVFFPCSVDFNQRLVQVTYLENLYICRQHQIEKFSFRKCISSKDCINQFERREYYLRTCILSHDLWKLRCVTVHLDSVSVFHSGKLFIASS